MFRRLKAILRPRSDGPIARALPPGQIIYAVGDIHGQHDLLKTLLARIAEDAASAPTGTVTTLIMLGDYIDRGLGSRDVIDTLSQLSDFPARIRFLKGNHEQAMLEFLDDPAVGAVWVQYGGGETLAAYGVKPPAPDAPPDTWQAAQTALLEAMPEHHRSFLNRLEPYVVTAPYLFVHAGVDPAKPLSEQTEQDLLWTRDKFIHSSRKFEYVVVHGHTPEEEPYRDDRRVGIDTGAYLTGVLTAVRLEDETVSFLQSRRSER